MTNTPPHFDRASQHKKQAGWVRNAATSKTSKYLLFHKGRVLATDNALAWCPHSEVNPDSPTIFLGLLDDAPCFAAVSESNVRSDDLRYRDIRSIGTRLPPNELPILCQAQSMVHWHSTCRYCERCGHALSQSPSGDKRLCENCNHEIFPRLNPVVIMLVEHNEHLLLGRQAQFPKGMYSCLAGFVEHGETIESAVRREVQEETGVKVSEVSYVNSQAWPFPAQLMIGCTGRAENTSIQTDDELEDAQWFHRSDIGQMLDFSHPKRYTIPPSIAIAHMLIKGWYSSDTDRS
jgi:NAD+ diphosphatase